MNRRPPLEVLYFLLLLGFGVQFGVAQTSTAQLVGQILDQSGDPIPEAKIFLANCDTGIQRQAFSNE